MSLVLKVSVIGILLGILAPGCRRKSDPNTMSAWLQKNYPGRFHIISTYTIDPIRQMSFKVKRSVIAESDNPLVQAELEWDKRQENLGLTKSVVDAIFIRAATNLKAAQELQQLLSNNGLQSTATGIYEGTARVMVFDLPSPDTREKVYYHVKNAVASWHGSSNYDLHVAFYEKRDSQYTEIYPVDYWATPGSAVLGNYTYSFLKNTPYTWQEEQPEGIWKFNTDSDRFSRSVTEMREEMTAWSAQHLARKIVLTSTSEFEQDPQDANVFVVKFPFVYEDTDSTAETVEGSAGFLGGLFNVDKGTLSNIRVVYDIEL